ncbi:hypothetical protein HNP38_000645 [Chryseobacterium defluvii]|uniref:DUF6705 domain-containing protein n=1 Tax=Chryseobacterium defluvii TaxID=160396 RepID=A0A840KCV9_9FLAO|nr:DUF6705 family protein [Chryseobacterium defluvii]MBB4805373.1 hypothetical protein [Chryseobacterium defluvii]
MKKAFLFILLIIITACKAQQIYPLRPVPIDLPENSYEKDTNNELQDYEGTWKGTWNGKTIWITLKKITYKYETALKYYRDYLIGKFVVKDANGLILFDNTNLPDGNAKIKGINFRKYGDKYSFIYIDMDLCAMNGSGRFNFTDSTKTKLEWKYSEDENIIDTDCFYYGWAQADRPQPLPNNIILTKQ